MTGTDSPNFTPKDPAFEARVRASFGRQGIMTLIGARLTRIEPGLVEIELPFRADLTQQHGFFHAGITSTIADSAGGYAAYSLMPDGASVPGSCGLRSSVMIPNGIRLSSSPRLLCHPRSTRRSSPAPCGWPSATVTSVTTTTIA